ncbi:MAG: response regulator [Alphaproteobacteria bacterium]|nr:response regulator [Alphaproteobacteria bacterium]
MARVLVVDDDEFFVTLMMQALTKHGHDVAFALEGVTGMKAFGSFDFDAVVCDMMMPEQDGEETIRQLRTSRPNIAIVAISGGLSVAGPTGADILDVALKQGANIALRKPFSLSALVAAVDAALASQRHRATAA